MKLQNNVGRSCGGCNACCKVFTVPEVGKRDSNWCLHCERGVGCKIYEQRPFACSEFACTWLNGVGDEGYRPDRLGVMLDSQDFYFPDRGVCVLHLWELEASALERPLMVECIELNMNAGNIVVLHEIRTPTTYSGRIRASKSHFSPEDMVYFQANVM